jgi:hypothetical protein
MLGSRIVVQTSATARFCYIRKVLAALVESSWAMEHQQFAQVLNLGITQQSIQAGQLIQGGLKARCHAC